MNAATLKQEISELALVESGTAIGCPQGLTEKGKGILQAYRNVLPDYERMEAALNGDAARPVPAHLVGYDGAVKCECADWKREESRHGALHNAMHRAFLAAANYLALDIMDIHDEMRFTFCPYCGRGLQRAEEEKTGHGDAL